MIRMGCAFRLTDFVLHVLFSCLAQLLVKTSCVLIRISFNFHPFELILELWTCTRVRVTKVNKNKDCRFMKGHPHSHNPNPQRCPSLEFELKRLITEGDMDQNACFFELVSLRDTKTSNGIKSHAPM